VCVCVCVFDLRERESFFKIIRHRKTVNEEDVQRKDTSLIRREERDALWLLFLIKVSLDASPDQMDASRHCIPLQQSPKEVVSVNVVLVNTTLKVGPSSPAHSGLWCSPAGESGHQRTFTVSVWCVTLLYLRFSSALCLPVSDSFFRRVYYPVSYNIL